MTDNKTYDSPSLDLDEKTEDMVAETSHGRDPEEMDEQEDDA